MNQPRLFTYSTKHTCTLSSTIWLIKGHISFDPYFLLDKLFMKLSLINIYNLLACPHQLCYLNDYSLLLLGNLFLLSHLTAV